MADVVREPLSSKPLRVRRAVVAISTLALLTCSLCGRADAGGPCSHDPCHQGEALDASCSPCVTQVCATDTQCCSQQWDLACALATETVCEQECAPLCGDGTEDRRLTAGDALFALKRAVGTETCPYYRCDYNGDGKIVALDALLILTAAVGTPAGSACPPLFHYVLSDVRLPSNNSQARDLGFNLDKDDEKTIDNGFGMFLAVFLNQGVNMQSAVDAAIDSGAAVGLASLASHDLDTAASATWRLLVGNPAAAAPLFDGSDRFTVADDGAMLGELEGAIVGGHLDAAVPEASAATFSILLALVPGQPPLRLDLVGGHVSADVTSEECDNGRLGGGITGEDMENSFLPSFAVAMNAHVPAECRPGAAEGDFSMCDLTSQQYLQIFDSQPRDGTITVEEVTGNALIGSLLHPDVDLLDASGNYDPNPNGEADSVSFGLGFDCVAARFSE